MSYNTKNIQRVPIIKVPRVPIIGITRIPITGITQDIPCRELQWDEVYNSLVNYIKFAAKQVAEQYQTSSVQSSEDLFQEGQLLLYHCYTIYKYKPMNQFSALFKASLWRKLREIGKKKRFIQVDIEDAYEVGYTPEVIEELYEDFRLQQLAEILENEPIALTIVKEFINPSTRTLWEARMDVARKQMLKDQNYNVAVPKSISIRGVHIQRALEISKSNFAQNFKIVKDSVNKVYKDAIDLEDII